MRRHTTLIIGHFAYNSNKINGQTIKTYNIYNALKLTSSNELLTIDTGTNQPRIFILFSIIFKMLRSKYVIILPAHNGVKILLPIIVSIAFFFRCNVYYIVIGGWLPRIVHENPYLKAFIRRIKCIYVETFYMKKSLVKYGVNNVEIMKNFKIFTQVSNIEEYNVSNDFKLCFLARVTEKKGIIDLIDVVNQINQDGPMVKLDIYGPLDDEFKEKKLFDQMINNSQGVSYRGVIDPNETNKVLSDYTFLVFPTKFFTEGIPGTIIDAYFSGVPVIASNWQSANEVVIDGITGYLYDFDSKTELKSKILFGLENRNMIEIMKRNCIEKSKEYSYKNEIVKITRYTG